MIDPYCGELVDLCLKGAELDAAKAEADMAPRIMLTDTAICDLELLMTGGFSPLRGFMCKADYTSVVNDMRLSDGTLWPLPVTLEAPADSELKAGDTVALHDKTGVILALLDVEEMFEADLDAEAERIYAANEEHPTLAKLRGASAKRLGGAIRGIQLPAHFDFKTLRRTPAEVRELFRELGWKTAVAFQTRNPLHRAHEELIRRSREEAGADGVMIHSVVGVTKPGDVAHFTRVRCYQAMMKYFDKEQFTLSLLPLAMRMAGPREALLHAIIRRNHGCSHLIVGRDHAGPGSDSAGNAFYGPYDAQDLMREHEADLGIKMVPFRMCVYLPDEDEYRPVDEVAEGAKTLSISGTQVREEYLAKDKPLPEWFTRPEVAELLAEAYPPSRRKGVTIWFTGLSASGKSTLAQILAGRLLEYGRAATLLDGDVVRTHLSKGLTFSKEDRDINIRRIGFVASEITRHGGTVICAAISPYRQIRDENRALIGNFIEVYANAPVEVCEARDKKGNYKKARAGIIKGFTGIDDPYEEPLADFVECRTDMETTDECVEKIMHRLRDEGFI